MTINERTATIDDAPAEGTHGTVVPKPHFFIVLEADRPQSRGVRFALDDIEEIVIGRGAERRGERKLVNGKRRLAITLPGRALSGEHARIVREAGVWRVEDTGSRNGTFVDGTRVTRTALEDGAFVEMGRTFMMLRAACPTPLDTPMDTTDATLAAAREGMRTLLPWLAHRHATLARIAATTVPVMLLGETGTGKELVAHAIHAASGRRGPFVPINCGALPEALVEGLLFGHARGAFSGAVRDEVGFVRSAEGGTLFLDEIGDLPASSQTALLRVLQESEIVPVGTTRSVKVDVRVISATHQPIDQLVAAGTFRRDLLGRVRGYVHALPRLDERREDFGIIIADLLARIGGSRTEPLALSRDAARALLTREWPMNVRELAQCLTTAAALTEGGTIGREHLPDEPSAATVPDSPEALDTAATPQELEQQLTALLQRHEGNVTAVARAMGKRTFQIHRWMKRFGIDPNTLRP